MPRIEMVMLLQGVDLFKFCSVEEIVRIASIADQRTFEQGQEIYRRRDPARTLYCVVDGEVVLEGEGGDDVRVGRQEAFGVIEILSGRLRSRSARAAGPVNALAIGEDDFFDLLSNNEEIVKALFRKVLDGDFSGNGWCERFRQNPLCSPAPGRLAACSGRA